ncbi:hypothetical protein HDU98_010058, partial [Podochytrium sp. JEL0797]
QEIGLVHPLMKNIATVGVLTNAIVIAFASSSFQANVVDRFPENSQLAIRILFVVAFEHFVGAVRVLVKKFVSSVPDSVRVAVGRRVYRTALETVGNPEDFEQNDGMHHHN